MGTFLKSYFCRQKTKFKFDICFPPVLSPPNNLIFLIIWSTNFSSFSLKFPEDNCRFVAEDSLDAPSRPQATDIPILETILSQAVVSKPSKTAPPPDTLTGTFGVKFMKIAFFWVVSREK